MDSMILEGSKGIEEVGMKKVNKQTCHVRILNAVPDTGAVNVYVNGKLYAGGLPYRGFTEYYAAGAGYYDFEVKPAAGHGGDKAEERIELLPHGIYTIAVTGTRGDLAFTVIYDTPKAVEKGRVFVRFANLSPNDSSYDITLNGSPVVAGLDYTDTSGYDEMNPGVYNLKIYNAGDDVLLMTNPKMELRAGKFYGVYVIGFANASPKLQVLIPLEGATYIKD